MLIFHSHILKLNWDKRAEHLCKTISILRELSQKEKDDQIIEKYLFKSLNENFVGHKYCLLKPNSYNKRGLTSVYPRSQSHLYEPSVSIHCSPAAQDTVGERHSSMSTMNQVNIQVNIRKATDKVIHVEHLDKH